MLNAQQKYDLNIDQNLINPTFSPDGNYIALTDKQYSGIFVYDQKKEKITDVTNRSAAGFGMSWSADGEWILAKPATFKQRRRFNDITAYHYHSSDTIVFTENETYLPGNPNWGEDSRFVYMNGGKGLNIYNQPGLNKGNIQSGFIVYSSNNSIFKYNFQTGNNNTLYEGQGSILDLQQSPDGRKVVFEVVGGELMVLDIESLEKIQLGVGHEPDWNPESNKIAYMITEDDGHVITASDIYIINADGSEKMNLTLTSDQLEMRPDWHTGGQWIIFDLDGLGPISIQEIE